LENNPEKALAQWKSLGAMAAGRLTGRRQGDKIVTHQIKKRTETYGIE